LVCFVEVSHFELPRLHLEILEVLAALDDGFDVIGHDGLDFVDFLLSPLQLRRTKLLQDIDR